ncbi:MAG TPA: sensor histidine kinase [Vicinamibacterales bacterium]
MSTIRARLLLLVATAAIAPLVAYGFVSLQLLRTATSQSATAEAEAVAESAAGQIERYVQHNLDLIEAVAADLSYTSLSHWQQERILRNYVIAFPAFSELTLFDESGRAIASSRLTAPTLTLTGDPPPAGAPRVAPIQIDDAMLPSTEVTLRVELGGSSVAYLVGGLRLEELWKLVDQIRVGGRGHALLVDETGRLLAHGDPDQKPAVARGEDLAWHPLIHQQSQQGPSPRWLTYTTPAGEELLGVMHPISGPGLDWRVIVEQRTAEAYALATRLERFLLLTIVLGLVATTTIGLLWGRAFVRPIDALMRGTRALSEGRLTERVAIAGRDEFAQLGDAFNRMADRLVALQDEAVKQERQATFGRIAAGLVHDLAHPIQNIGNNCKLMLKMYDDPEYRETFRRMVDREFAAIRRLLEDLRNLGRPIPLERFPVDVNRSLAEAIERMQLLAEQSGVTLELLTSPEPIAIEGDLFALGRVYRNLMLNAVQATAPGGYVRVSSRLAGRRVLIEISDTGCGIARERLATIFDDYTTTKRRGLGLGLAISRKIVEQLGGTIRVESEVGKGTAFTLDFPALAADRLLQASA